MAHEPVQPLAGRRPVYPVDPPQPAGDSPGGGAPPAERRPRLPADGSKDDPGSDENTESANHPNDE